MSNEDVLNLINQFHELEYHRVFSLMIPFTILYFAWYYLEWGLHTTLTPNILKTENSGINWIPINSGVNNLLSQNDQIFDQLNVISLWLIKYPQLRLNYR